MAGAYERLSMSSIVALFHLVNHVRANGGDIAEAVNIVPHTTSDCAPHDYVGAAALGRFVGGDEDLSDIPRTLRQLLAGLIDAERPGWLSVVQTGRDAVRPWLAPNALEVFAHAELFDSLPSVEVVAWWDRLAMPAWASVNPELLARGREAERRSFEIERTRLAREQCPEAPKWVSLDDNTAGFDIASWRNDGSCWAPLLIEVKATTRPQPAFHLSRNEFDTAVRARSNFLFHVWVRGVLRVLDREVVVSAAPADGGSARWESAFFEFE